MALAARKAPAPMMMLAVTSGRNRVKRVMRPVGELQLKRSSRPRALTRRSPALVRVTAMPAVDEADANVELQESMLDAGVNLPRPRRTVDGHGLYGNVRVYEWPDMPPPTGATTTSRRRVA